MNSVTEGGNSVWQYMYKLIDGGKLSVVLNEQGNRGKQLSVVKTTSYTCTKQQRKVNLVKLYMFKVTEGGKLAQCSYK